MKLESGALTVLTHPKRNNDPILHAEVQENCSAFSDGSLFFWNSFPPDMPFSEWQWNKSFCGERLAEFRIGENLPGASLRRFDIFRYIR
jgi:hypothetical protein